MAVEIVQVGDVVLRQAARPLTLEEIPRKDTQQLIDKMREVMRAAPGVGLAAPQIGISLQLAVIEDRAEYVKDIDPQILADRERKPVPFLVLINPQIVERSADEAEFFEGCLSLSGFSAVVKRARGVTVEFLDREGNPQRMEARGWFARILQHEIDHLNGCLYIDRMQSRSFMNLDHLTRYWKDLPMERVRKELRLDLSVPGGQA